MANFALIYETNAATGLPTLRVLEGPANAVSDAEFKELDRELQSKYEHLRREPVSSIRVRSKQYTVESKDPNGSRQPTLVIRPSGAKSTALTATHSPTSNSTWVREFYAEIERLANNPAIPRVEAHSLKAAIEELQDGDSQTLAPKLLMAYLAGLNQLCRLEDRDRAGLYALALRALGRVMPGSADESGLLPSPGSPDEKETTTRLWRTFRMLMNLPGLLGLEQDHG